MRKDEKAHAPVAPKKDEMPQTGCVVCGSYDGEMPETAGHARWHKFCGDARPDVIKKVKARA